MTDNSTDRTATDQGPTPEDVMREQRLQRNLKILVAGLGLLIVLGLGALAIRMTQVVSGAKPVPAASVTVSGAGKDLSLELPKGARIVSVSLSDNRLAVHHEGPAGAGIAIIDLETGARIADVKPREAVPRN